MKSKIANVVATYGKDTLIEFQNKCYNLTARKSVQNIVVGDSVEFQENVITKILPRRNLLKANNKYIASNIDHIFLTLAINPYPQLLSIDNYLIKAKANSINISIIINKSDLTNKKNIDIVADIYKNIGYGVDFISADSGKNINSIVNKITNKTCIFVGQSGVGKSSIINYITKKNQRVNILGADGLGKHTTTNSSVFKTANNGKIIDTPGVREFDPQDTTRQEIINGFIEFEGLIEKCKFHNCIHINEPNCEIKKQVQLAKISNYRYQNYKQLMQKKC